MVGIIPCGAISESNRRNYCPRWLRIPKTASAGVCRRNRARYAPTMSAMRTEFFIQRISEDCSHKTQVFFNAKNDHICTRMEHVLYVRAISTTIGRTLGLNQDLINAIALGHDIGHAPFGHSGERALHNCIHKINPALSFRHEYHSLRVVDRLSTRISREKIHERCGLI